MFNLLNKKQNAVNTNDAVDVIEQIYGGITTYHLCTVSDTKLYDHFMEMASRLVDTDEDAACTVIELAADFAREFPEIAKGDAVLIINSDDDVVFTNNKFEA